jgi:hypothetical protein
VLAGLAAWVRRGRERDEKVIYTAETAKARAAKARARHRADAPVQPARRHLTG